ncbi:MAG: hypothetical protein WC510_07615 [Candidatus Omnitrophota bacterium]
MKLNWIKCSGEQWCRLLYVNLLHQHFDGFEGIYIIWHGQPDPAVVYVGQGNIRERLTQHKQDHDILAYQDRGLLVTWARVDSANRDGIERFLAERWNPKVGHNYPLANPISVNSPWDK